VQHSLEDLIAQRVYGLVQGYEDVNDHDCSTRCLALPGNLDSQHPQPHWQVRVHSIVWSSSKSPKDISAKDRYLRIALKPQAIEQLLIDLFFNLSDPVPGRIF